MSISKFFSKSKTFAQGVKDFAGDALHLVHDLVEKIDEAETKLAEIFDKVDPELKDTLLKAISNGKLSADDVMQAHAAIQVITDSADAVLDTIEGGKDEPTG